MSVESGGKTWDAMAADGTMPVGFQFQQRWNVYEFLGYEEYFRNTDGKPINLLVWRSWCYECGEAFKFKTTNNVSAQSMNRRCGIHAKPGKRTRKKSNQDREK